MLDTLPSGLREIAFDVRFNDFAEETAGGFGG